MWVKSTPSQNQEPVSKGLYLVVLITLTALKVSSVTLRIYHTQQKEATKEHTERVVTTSSDKTKDKTEMGPKIMIVLICPPYLPLGKTHNLHIMLGLESIKQ